MSVNIKLQENIKHILKDIKYVSKSINNSGLKLVIDGIDILEAIRTLKNNAILGFNILTDIVAIDWQEKYKKRFEVIYILTSTVSAQRVMVSVFLDEDEEIESLSYIFTGANWLEREVWDMFGIPFINHPDLRRLLSDYGFEGHPLRKDFPLSGYKEVEYSKTEGKVVYKPVKLEQEYRSFASQSQWEGNFFSGDEKVNLNALKKES